jgi:hypothetical protein
MCSWRANTQDHRQDGPACTPRATVLGVSRPRTGNGGHSRVPYPCTSEFPFFPGQRPNSIILRWWSGAGSNCRPSAFQGEQRSSRSSLLSAVAWAADTVVAGRSGVGALDDDGRGDGAGPTRTRNDRAEGTVPCIEFCHALDVLPGTALTMLVVMRARCESGTGFDVVLDIVVPRAFDGPVARNDLAWLVGLGR